MHKFISVFCFASIAASLMAAPTANEDFVVSEDAKTYTNAVDAAKEYTDEKIGAIDVGVTSVNGSTGAVTLDASDVGAVSKGKNSGVSFELGPPPRNVGGTTLEFSNTAIRKSSIHEYENTSDIDFSFWNWLSYDEVGLGDFLSYKFETEIAENAGVTSVNDRTGDVTLDASDVGAFGADAGASLQTQVEELGGQVQTAFLYSMGVYNYMNGNTNAWWSGTNYVFGADAAARTRFAWSPDMDAATVPCSMALWEIRDGMRQCVWDQRDWTVWYWNYVSSKFRQEIAATNALINAAITNRAPRAWSGTTAATGLDNPDRSTTWVDTPTLTLAPGMAWETVAHVGGCGYWGIVGDGTVIGGSGTNATLEIRDFEGKTVMRVVKGDSRLVYLECGSDIYTSGYDAQGRVTFTMRSDSQPVGEFTTVLDTSLFVEETDENCPVDYEWETVTAGSVYRCHFLVKQGIDADSCFARFKSMRNENTRIEYEADQVVSGGLIFNGVKIAPVIPANVSVGDTVPWKVIAK